MDNTIIVAVDLGHFKAYRVTKDPHEISPRVALIESYDSLEGRLKLGDKLSDSAGRFGRGGGTEDPAKGTGERCNIVLETEKRLIKMIVKDIDHLIANEKCKRWHLAAGEKINRQIIENLPQKVKGRLDKNISSNLTKTNKSEILSYFS